MPYYVWRGVDLEAKIRRGAQFAPHEKELDQLLLQKNIALLSFKFKRSWKLFRTITLQQKRDYFFQIALLLKAGIRLPDALQLVASQVNNSRFSDYAYSIAQKVTSGIALSAALADHPLIFDPMMIQLTKVAEESGNLTAVLQVLTAHLDSQIAFRAKVKAALLMPCMTLGFFFTILLVMFTFVVPQFAQLFKSMNVDLPSSTRMMFEVSNLLKSTHGIALIMFFIMILVFMMRCSGSKQWMHQWISRLPFLSRFMRERAQGLFLQALSFLFKGGVSVTTAFEVAKTSISEYQLGKEIEEIQKNISAGQSLYLAMISDLDHQWQPEVLALIKIGQESGSLPEMLEKSAELYQEKLSRSLAIITTMIQPLLMVLLGLLITALILSLYTPIFTLSNSIRI